MWSGVIVPVLCRFVKIALKKFLRLPDLMYFRAIKTEDVEYGSYR